MVRKQSFRMAPSKRRKIRKRIIYPTAASLVIAGNSFTLDTIEEEETLVRVVGNICFTPLINSPGALVAELKVNPSGTVLNDSAVAGDTLEGRDAGAVLWHYKLQDSNADAANAPSYLVDLDVKAMRKLKEGDTITVETDADTDNGFNFFSGFTLFYKKA